MALEARKFEFGEFVLDADERVVLRDGRPLQITPKVLQLLLTLVENHGHIVEKNTLMDKVWANSFVEESNLTFSIRQLRKILCDDRHTPRFVETVPRRGYRFIAEVKSTASNGITENGHSRQRPVTFDEPVRLQRKGNSRPVLIGGLAVLLGSVFLSAAVFVWRGGYEQSGEVLGGSPAALQFETIASSDRPMTAAISPDGRYMVFSRTVNGLQSLWLRQLSSDVNSQIVPPEEGVIYFEVEFSPDGEHIYFSRRLRDGPVRIDRVSMLGGAPKVSILNDVDGSFNISPDGSLISFRRFEPKKRSLLIANSDGTGEREIYQTSKTFTDNSFSPDSKTIAFASGQSDTGERDFGIYTIDVETGNVRSATEFRWLHVRSIIWQPDGTGMLATGTMAHSNPSRLWHVSLANGEVREWGDSQPGVTTISATADTSKMLLTRIARNSDLYLAPSTNPDSLQPVGEAGEGISWAPNGSLVYSASVSNKLSIWRLDKDKINQKQLTAGDSNDFDPKTSPDGRHVVFVSDRAGRYNVWRIGSNGSNPVALTTGQGEQKPEFTRDGSEVVFTSMTDLSLWKVSIDGGAPVKVSDDRAYNVSISPNGQMFAYLARIDGEKKLAIRSLESGRLLSAFDTPSNLFPDNKVRWTNDGNTIVYTAFDSNGVGNLWRQMLSGGSPEQVSHYDSDEIFNFTFSPDGNQIALVRGTWRYDVVLAQPASREIASSQNSSSHTP